MRRFRGQRQVSPGRPPSLPSGRHLEPPPVAAPVRQRDEVVAAAKDLVQYTRSHDGPCEPWVLSEGCSRCREAYERRWTRLSTAVMAVEEER